MKRVDMSHQGEQSTKHCTMLHELRTVSIQQGRKTLLKKKMVRTDQKHHQVSSSMDIAPGLGQYGANAQSTESTMCTRYPCQYYNQHQCEQSLLASRSASRWYEHTSSAPWSESGWDGHPGLAPYSASGRPVVSLLVLPHQHHYRQDGGSRWHFRSEHSVDLVM